MSVNDQLRWIFSFFFHMPQWHLRRINTMWCIVTGVASQEGNKGRPGVDGTVPLSGVHGTR